MEFNSNMTDILNIQSAIFKFNAIAIRRECNRVKSVLALEPWEARRISLLNAPEKGLKSFVQLSENILRTTKIKLGNTSVNVTNFFKCVGLIIIIDGFMPLFITSDSMLKSTVIKKASRIKKTVQFNFLSFIYEQSVFKRLSHFLRFLSQYGDLHLGHIRTSGPRGIHLCPQRKQVNFWTLIFIPISIMHRYIIVNNYFKKKGGVRHFLANKQIRAPCFNL